MTDSIEIKKDIENVSNSVEAISKTRAGIAELVKRFRGAVFDVRTPKGMKDAKSAAAVIKTPRFAIERLRKEAKAPILALGRSLDKMAGDLTAQIRALEDPIVLQIQSEVNRVERERQDLVDAENNRVNVIKEKIANLFDGVDQVICSNRTSANLVKCIAAYKSRPIDRQEYAEFFRDAETTWSAAVARLEAHLKLVITREAEDKQIAADRAELEQLRKTVAATQPAPTTDEIPMSTNIGTSDDSNPEPVVDDETLSEGPQQDSCHSDDTQDATEYPGDQAIAVALADYFGVPVQTSTMWMAALKSSDNKREVLF